MASVGEEFPKEQERVRELLVEYRALGAVGVFGAVQLAATLKRADEAAMSGDLVAVLRSFQEMKECQ